MQILMDKIDKMAELTCSLLHRKLAGQDVSLKKTTSKTVSFKNDDTVHGDLMGSKEQENKIMTLKLNEMSSEKINYC